MPSKVSRPVITDRWLDLAFAIKYLIFSAFALVGVFWTVPAIQELSGALYVFFWASSVFIIGLAAASLVFYNVYFNYAKLLAIRWEWYLNILITGLVLTYSLSLLTLSLQGFEGRYSISVLSLALLVFPIWRIRYLYRLLRGKIL